MSLNILAFVVDQRLNRVFGDLYLLLVSRLSLAQIAIGHLVAIELIDLCVLTETTNAAMLVVRFVSLKEQFTNRNNACLEIGILLR